MPGNGKGFCKMEATHILNVENRNKTTLTGIEEVISFSETQVELQTSMGQMIIKGKGLTMSKLDTDTGKLDISGEIELMEYTDIKKKRGLLEGLFG